MKHRADQTGYRNNSGFKNTVSTAVAVPITYDEQKKIYQFKEKKQLPGTSQDTGISSKQLRHTCDKLSIVNQAVTPVGCKSSYPDLLISVKEEFYEHISFATSQTINSWSGQ